MALPSRVLIANRGEIAVRIIRACRDLGIETVAVYSEADRTSRHVSMADRAVCIGPPAAAQSYLCVPSLIMAATLTGADAVHPGYGFLAENPQLAEACLENGITFIGPTPDAIRLLGDKARARAIATSLGIPVVPGFEAALAVDEVERRAEDVGFPLLIKAVAGGGGRGMLLVASPDRLQEAWHRAQAEAAAAFGNGALYLERYLENVRHVEAQVLGDDQGNVVHLGERDCTLQRRHQKILEEAPSTAISEALREHLLAAAVRLCRHIGYRNAGTVEFIVDTDRERFYFIEMNTRLQVEHPVTEMRFGVDIVTEQIRIAGGEPLGFAQGEIHPTGHAIECRINAEDADADFRPCPGRIDAYREPCGPWVRIDSHCYAGYVVPPYYDSLLAKLIVLGKDRETAIRRMQRALAEFVIEGVPTTIPHHQKVLRSRAFAEGRYNTRGLQTLLARVGAPS